MHLPRSYSRPWRWPAAVSLAAIAGIHIALVPAHLREAPYAGALFMALSLAALAIAILLLISSHQLVWVGAGALSLTAILAYVLSRSVGLPSLPDDVGDWLNPLGVAALLSETAAAWICWRALRPVLTRPGARAAWSGAGASGYGLPSRTRDIGRSR